VERAHADADQRPQRHREKVLTPPVGELNLEIPKVRTGGFPPSLLE
jgi:transposase-like protein